MKMPDVPHQVPWVGPPLIKVDWGRSHSLLLDSEGGVWEAGTSGVDNSEFTSNFRRVEGLPEITQISAGYDHSAVIDTEGNLWVWSGHPCYQRLNPQQISLPSKLSKVACGWGQLLAEGQDGALWNVKLLENDTKIVPILVEGLALGPLCSLCVLLCDALLVDAGGSVFKNYQPAGVSDSENWKSLPWWKHLPGAHISSCWMRNAYFLEFGWLLLAFGGKPPIAGGEKMPVVLHQVPPDVPPRGWPKLLSAGKGRIHSLALDLDDGVRNSNC